MPAISEARCACGAVTIEMTQPAVWAWHDHTPATRHAHGAASATYVGSWESKVRVTDGEELIATWEDPERKTTRRFCARCGTPLMYIRAHSPKMINIPRALFTGRTSREPRYHVGIDAVPDWAYDGGKLVPLKGYPGVVWQRPTRRRSR